MKILEKVDVADFPFHWANLDFYPDSRSYRLEINLENQQNAIEELIYMFYNLFSKLKSDINIYNASWWDYCTDTWDIENDKYDYTLKNKSDETLLYLSMLAESSVEVGYSGSCKCLNWDKFLFTTLKCLFTDKAPYSPLFYSQQSQFFFYFHHTGGIGLYYETENSSIANIISIAKELYLVG